LAIVANFFGVPKVGGYGSPFPRANGNCADAHAVYVNVIVQQPLVGLSGAVVSAACTNAGDVNFKVFDSNTCIALLASFVTAVNNPSSYDIAGPLGNFLCG